MHLICQIIQEEIQCIVAPVEGSEPKLQSIETIIKEEIENTLPLISSRPSGWTEVRLKHRSAHSSREGSMSGKPQTTDWFVSIVVVLGTWYITCHERNAVFDAYRAE